MLHFQKGLTAFTIPVTRYSQTMQNFTFNNCCCYLAVFLDKTFAKVFLDKGLVAKGVFLTLCKVYKEEIRKEKRP